MSTALATMKLYEITAELEDVAAELIENDGELTPDLEARLDAAEGALHAKVERCALVIQQLQAHADMARNESRRLADLASTRANAAQRLKEYVQHQMEIADLRKVEGDLATVWVQKNGRPSISWTREIDELPDAYRRIAISPDTNAAYDTWKAGGPLPEGFMVEQGHHLRIK